MNGLELARAALRGKRAWLVGGAVRDRALGHEIGADLDVVIDGDPGGAAEELARLARSVGTAAACFELSHEFGGWRVIARDGSWQVDVEPLRGGSLEADLFLRDFTVNAVAEPVGGGATIDPLGGLEDLAVGRLRAVSPGAFVDDPLRVLRLVRLSVEREMRADRSTIALARASAHGLGRVAPERIFAELSRIIDASEAVCGLALLREVGAVAVVLPELEALQGVQQNRYHHLDVLGHTVEVLGQVIALQSAPEQILGPAAAQVGEMLAEPLADGLSRGSALRWGALLHDIAKPLTRAVEESGRVTFYGHDRLGAQLAGEILLRLRASTRFRAHVAALVRGHLRLGFLVHEPQPLSRRAVFAYLRHTDPVQVDVTLLSVADRLATRGDNAQAAIEAHLRLAVAMLGDALRWEKEGAPRPLLRGDELAREAGIAPGPVVGQLIESLTEAQYAGEVLTREQACAFVHASCAAH